MTRVVTMTVLVTAIAALVALQAGIVQTGGQVSYRAWPVPAPAGATVDIGATTLPLARNSWRAWRPSDLASVNAFEHAIRKHASVVMWYADWAEPPPSLRQLDAVAARGSIPEITWEPWDSSTPIKQQPRFRLANILDGRFDAYIRTWARSLAAYGRPVRLRFAQEMNGGWYPWSERANGNHAGEFVRVWRHVHDLFRAAGAANVLWVWSPAAINLPAELYPGDRYVDMVSLSLFNGGGELHYRRWQSFEALIAPSLRRLRRLAPGKPVELSEVGCGEQGGSKAAWIAGMFAFLRQHPEVTSILWYDLVKGTDWRVESSRASASAFAASVADHRYR
jgi:beta-mannanase